MCRLPICACAGAIIPSLSLHFSKLLQNLAIFLQLLRQNIHSKQSRIKVSSESKNKVAANTNQSTLPLSQTVSKN
jgi:hypothetical protein